VCSPVARWLGLAYLIVACHRVVMVGLYFGLLAVLLRLLVKEHPGAALVASGLMAAGFVGTFWLAPTLLAVSPRPARRGTARRALLRLYRVFVGNGDAIQALARRIDAGWQNPYTGRTPQETTRWLASMEVIALGVAGGISRPRRRRALVRPLRPRLRVRGRQRVVQPRPEPGDAGHPTTAAPAFGANTGRGGQHRSLWWRCGGRGAGSAQCGRPQDRARRRTRRCT
jgi:hypothetical protein